MLSILTSFIVCGCNTENVEIKSTDIELNDRGIYIYTMDGCEWVGNVYGGNADILTHRGQCKYCKVRNEEMIRSIIQEVLSEDE